MVKKIKSTEEIQKLMEEYKNQMWSLFVAYHNLLNEIKDKLIKKEKGE